MQARLDFRICESDSFPQCPTPIQASLVVPMRSALFFCPFMRCRVVGLVVLVMVGKVGGAKIHPDQHCPENLATHCFETFYYSLHRRWRGLVGTQHEYNPITLD